MTYCPPNRSPRQAAKSSNAPQRVEAQEGQKSGRRRGGGRGRKAVTREIQRTAQKRQATWLDDEPREVVWMDGQPTRNATYTLTRKLDGLYGEHRGDQAGTFTDPYAGRTWKGAG